MSYRIIDVPRPVTDQAYQHALEKMTQRIMKTKSAIAVYQAGSVSAPGISDLDMIIVFKDNIREEHNFLSGLTAEERYLFIHNLYGISFSNFAEARRFAFHNYRLLAGDELINYPEPGKTEILHVQTALEFIVKLHITLYIQEKYDVLRMRDLLLHVKALQYDLDLLGVSRGLLPELVNQVFEWRSRWFMNTPSEKEIVEWWKRFYSAFGIFLGETFAAHRFYLPPQPSYSIAKNITLIPQDKISASTKGIRLPGQLSMFGKKFFKLQNKLIRFEFGIPVSSNKIPELLVEKFQLEKKLASYNRQFLPAFLPLTSSLHAV